jgi:anaerobic glycerol-3-phosphate dehydrogenase
MSNKYQSDIACIDGGLAGLKTAIEPSDHDKQVLYSKKNVKYIT